MCVGPLAGVTYLRYTVLTRPKKAETAVHCCYPALSVLVMLVSRNVFHVVSALPLYTLFWLIRSLVDPKLEVFIVCGPLQLVTLLRLVPATTKSPEEFTRRDWSQGLVPRTVHTKRFEEQVAGTCPKTSN